MLCAEKLTIPRLIVAWPSAELAVMSGNSAAKVLLQIEKASLEKKGEKITPEKETALFNKIKRQIRQSSISILRCCPNLDRCHYRSLRYPNIGLVWVLKLQTTRLLKNHLI